MTGSIRPGIEGTDVLMRKGAKGIADVNGRCSVTVGEVIPPLDSSDADAAAAELGDRVRTFFVATLGDD
jgi:hypothetical protein